MFTILGSSGFVGRALKAHLIKLGEEVFCPGRDENITTGRHLGTVFYCIGMTANFRERPFDTVNAHVEKLMHILKNYQYEKLIYLSSTRLYLNSISSHESSDIIVRPKDREYVYNITKTLGENLTLSHKPGNFIVRLSNVLGPGMGSNNFIGSILKDAQASRSVEFQTPPSFAKDYIWIDDVVTALNSIISMCDTRIVNFASGKNITNSEIATWLKSRNVHIFFSDNDSSLKYPKINNMTFQDILNKPPSNGFNKLQNWFTENKSATLGDFLVGKENE